MIGIGRLAHLDKCTNAVEVNLSDNQVRKENVPVIIYPETHFPPSHADALCGLQLHRLDGFPSLTALRSLNLSGNKLTSIGACLTAIEWLTSFAT